jgi:hypothetical protein
VHWWNSLRAPEGSLLCTHPIWEHQGESGRISVAVLSCWVVQWWLPNYFIFCPGILEILTVNNNLNIIYMTGEFSGMFQNRQINWSCSIPHLIKKVAIQMFDNIFGIWYFATNKVNIIEVLIDWKYFIIINIFTIDIQVIQIHIVIICRAILFPLINQYFCKYYEIFMSWIHYSWLVNIINL